MKKREKQYRRFDVMKSEDKTDLNGKCQKRVTPLKRVLGCVFALLFVLTSLSCMADTDALNFTVLSFVGVEGLYIASVFEVAAAFYCFFPQKEFGVAVIQQPKSDRRLTKRTIFAAVLVLLAIPFTIYLGTYFFGNRKYYFISLLIILETMLPFCMVFESRKPQARELVVISVLCAIAVAGRAAFFMLPQFKPVVALVIIAGVCFGGETGFPVGAVTGFVSNFFFGQGPWTPWQMFAFGIIGFLAGVLFKKGFLRKTRASLCVFGFLTTFIIYGGIMNPASIIMVQNKITAEMLLSACIVGLPFDLVHGISTAFFLWFIAEAMIDKLERIKVKYGLIER